MLTTVDYSGKFRCSAEALICSQGLSSALVALYFFQFMMEPCFGSLYSPLLLFKIKPLTL